MENFRFILENPHPNASNKQRKRARLVTACDSCRVKKIKCQQTSPNGKCEACKIAKTPCLFGDRDRYQAERGVSCAWIPPVQDVRPLATPSPPSFSDISLRQTRPAYSPYATTRSPKQLPSSMSRSGTPSTFPPTYSHTPDSSYSSSTSSSNNSLQSTRQYQQTPSSSDNYASFDNVSDEMPLDPHFPHPQRMRHLATLFFDTIGRSFPFLDRVDILHRIEQKTCSAILANCIAGLALRYTSNPENLSISSGFYNMAKNLAANVSAPSIEALHALICITWSEYGFGQIDTFLVFSRMAITMCLELGLGHEATVQVAMTPEVRTRLRLTWWTVVCVADIAASWATGRPTTIDLSKYDTELPQGNDEPTVLFRGITQLYLLRNKVGRAVESYVGNRSNTSLDWTLSQIQSELQQIVQSLPPSLVFNLENLASVKQCGLDVMYIQTHFFIHSMTILINQPSLLAPYGLFMTSQNTQLENARSSAKYFTEMVMVLQDIIITSLQEPFMDLPFLVVIRFLMMDVQTSPINSNNGKPWQSILLDICKDALVSLSSQCGNNTSFETLLNDKGGFFHSKAVSLPNAQSRDLFTVSDSSLDWLLRPDDSSSDTSGSFQSSSRELSPLIPPQLTPSREPPSFIRAIPSSTVHSVQGYSSFTRPPNLSDDYSTLTTGTSFYQYGDCTNSGPSLPAEPEFAITSYSQRNLENLKPFAYQAPLPWPLTS